MTQFQVLFIYYNIQFYNDYNVHYKLLHKYVQNAVKTWYMYKAPNITSNSIKVASNNHNLQIDK